MIRFARTGTKVAAIAAVGVTALAACSSSSSPSGVVKAGSGFAGIPAPAAKHVAGGTVTFGMAAGATPTYIFPIVPGADSSVYTISYFQQLFWRPLWWTPVGHSLNVNYPLSLAKAPVWSNGNTTVTISMDTNYKWSNGQPVDAQDVIFYIDLLKAAVKLSPANSGNYTPGYFPDNVKSAVATSKFTVQLNLTKAYNPNYYFYDQLLLITPLPSTAWNIDNGGRPGGGLHQPEERREDLHLPERAVAQAVDLRDQPAVADRGRAVQAHPVQPEHGRQHHGAEPGLQRPEQADHQGLPGSGVHLGHSRVHRSA